MITWSLAYLLSEWLIRIVMLPVVVRRKQLQTAMAWLLVIFFLPLPGLILYLILGEVRGREGKIDRYLDLLHQTHRLLSRYRKYQHDDLMAPMNPVQKATMIMAKNMGRMPITGGNKVRFITSTELSIEALIHGIDQAQVHIHLLYYIFAPDSTGNRVVDALINASTRGVQCRLIVDAVGSKKFIKSNSKKLLQAGIELVEARPVSLLRRPLSRIDLRNHRKLTVIDGKTAFTGSQNIVDPDYGRHNLVWHDVMVRLEGPVVWTLQAVFLKDWYFETGVILDHQALFPIPSGRGKNLVQTLPSGPSYPSDNYHRMVVAALHDAQKQVTITTPYFVPDIPFLQAVEVAVLSGVKVTIVAPEKSDQIMVGYATCSYYAELMEMGAHVYLYKPGLLHAKTMTVDDVFSFVGSGNFDIRSFMLNYELNMVFYGASVTRKLRGMQKEYLKQSVKLDPEKWKERPGWKQTAESFAKLLSPLL